MKERIQDLSGPGIFLFVFLLNVEKESYFFISNCHFLKGSCWFLRCIPIMVIYRLQCEYLFS